MEWIRLKDKLPKEKDWIIGGNPKRVEMGLWIDGIFCLPHERYLIIEITHWMPLPNPPKEE